MKERVLKPEYQELAEDFDLLLMDKGGCTCHVVPPCSICTHSGNPECLGDTPEAWMVVEHLPKLYRVVYVPAVFEYPRLIGGEYTPIIDECYLPARRFLMPDGTPEWQVLEKNLDCRYMVDWYPEQWEPKHPDKRRNKFHVFNKSKPTIAQQKQNRIDWFGLL